MDKALTGSALIRKVKDESQKRREREDREIDEQVNAILDDFGRLFEERVPLFVPCEIRSKKPLVKWGDLKVGEEPSEAYYRILRDCLGVGGNIAIKLGVDSHNLCAIDFDDDLFAEEFIRHNPRLAETLCTRGSKGFQLWFYAIGDYPQEVKRISINGNESGTGEWRGGGGLSMLWGVHQNGNPYIRLTDVPPLDYAFSDIVFPPGWKLQERKVDDRPTVSKPGKRREGGNNDKYDFAAFNEVVAAGDGGIVESLVSEYFPGAKDDGKEWRCADISGAAPTNKGSFCITRNGWCKEWDGGYPDKNTGILQTITSQERAEATGEPRIGYREVFDFLKEETGEDFRYASAHAASRTSNENFVGDNIDELESQCDAATAKPILYLPVDGLTKINESARDCFKGMAATGEYFLRDGVFVKPRKSETEGVILNVIDNDQLPSQLEYVFELHKKYIDKDGNPGSRPVNCKPAEAKALLKATDEMLKYALPLRLLAASPVLIERHGKPHVLQQGYHPDEGGIYVISSLDIPAMSLDEAVAQLTDQLFADYDFASGSDYSRAIAQVLSPAMKLGNLLGDADFPLDVGLGDQSQSGKTHRMRFTAMVFGEKAYSLTKTKGGVGSLDEAIATALLSGKLFILIDNVRGEFDSQILESTLRGTGSVSARIPFRVAVLTQTGRSCWQLTSNTASFTTDLANRSIIVNNRKQPAGYQKKANLPWGNNFYAHVKRHQTRYLGAVHTVVSEWILQGKPRTTEDRHNFTAWSQSMDWIAQNIFNKPPLMDNHQTAQKSISDPNMAWFRQVVLKVAQGHSKFPISMQAWEIGEVCEDHGIHLPNQRSGVPDQRNQDIGKLLKPIFKHSDQVEIDAYRVTRTTVQGPKHVDKKYIISKI